MVMSKEEVIIFILNSNHLLSAVTQSMLVFLNRTPF